jgi:engulfment/cell motility protein 1
MQFFLRMWNESGSSVVDFTRIVALTRSQYVRALLLSSRSSRFRRVGVALRRENVRQWHEVEQDFLESDYLAVRERQMKELEEEDDLLSKVPVRLVGVYRR